MISSDSSNVDEIIDKLPTSVNETMVPFSVVCPDFKRYQPCYCLPDDPEGIPQISLVCNNWNLTDTEISDILDSFLSTPDVSPILRLVLSENRLTRVPNQVRFFDRLAHVDLQGNRIENVHSGAFGAQNHQMLVFLNRN